MNIRQIIKYMLYDKCPGFRGAFPYFGTRVYFTQGSRSFKAACEQGIFEQANFRVLLECVRPDTWMFDVGTNIGLMSIPILSQAPTVRVLSFEPSLNVLPSLQRTIRESPFAERWHLLPKAVGATEGHAKFVLSATEDSLFDGLRPTGRAEAVREVEVEVTTIDAEWTRLGTPEVSVIKVDVEGGELATLRGAVKCIEKNRPAILLEWNRDNLAAHDIEPAALFDLARSFGAKLFSLPYMVEVGSGRELPLHMTQTESFLLLMP